MVGVWVSRAYLIPHIREKWLTHTVYETERATVVLSTTYCFIGWELGLDIYIYSYRTQCLPIVFSSK